MTTRPRVGLIHATPIAIPPVRAAFADRWPEAEVLDLLDQGLLAVLEPDGSLGPRATDRMLRVIGLVRDADVGVIQLSCSAYSPLVPVLRQTASVPVLAIDDVLMETAVERGGSIGLISTGELAERSVRATAVRLRREIDLTAVVYREAAEALNRGDGAEHDRLLGAKIRSFADKDQIVLAQASMSRVLPTLPPELVAKVLTSPGLAVETARRAIDGTTA
jgi:hypothetical protein